MTTRRNGDGAKHNTAYWYMLYARSIVLISYIIYGDEIFWQCKYCTSLL